MTSTLWAAPVQNTTLFILRVKQYSWYEPNRLPLPTRVHNIEKPLGFRENHSDSVEKNTDFPGFRPVHPTLRKSTDKPLGFTGFPDGFPAKPTGAGFVDPAAHCNGPTHRHTLILFEVQRVHRLEIFRINSAIQDAAGAPLTAARVRTTAGAHEQEARDSAHISSRGSPRPFVACTQPVDCLIGRDTCPTRAKRALGPLSASVAVSPNSCVCSLFLRTSRRRPP